VSRHGGWKAQRSSSGARATSLETAVAPVQHRRKSACSLNVGFVPPALQRVSSLRPLLACVLGLSDAEDTRHHQHALDGLSRWHWYRTAELRRIDAFSQFTATCEIRLPVELTLRALHHIVPKKIVHWVQAKQSYVCEYRTARTRSSMSCAGREGANCNTAPGSAIYPYLPPRSIANAKRLTCAGNARTASFASLYTAFLVPSWCCSSSATASCRFSPVFAEQAFT